MLQQDTPEDFVIATGKQISVRSFIEKSAAELGISLDWQGKHESETGIVAAVTSDKAPAVKPGDVIVRIDPRYYRPTEVETLLGDPAKAKAKLGWVPEITLDQMIHEMVAADLAQAKQVSLLRQHGYAAPISKEN
jgi:GDPmannose 4,6-dehydratase